MMIAVLKKLVCVVLTVVTCPLAFAADVALRIDGGTATVAGQGLAAPVTLPHNDNMLYMVQDGNLVQIDMDRQTLFTPQTGTLAVLPQAARDSVQVFIDEINDGTVDAPPLIDVLPVSTVVRFEASGTFYREWPILEVARVDARTGRVDVLGTVEVNSSSLKTFTFSAPVSFSGAAVRLKFINDAYGGRGKDVNVVFKNIRIGDEALTVTAQHLTGPACRYNSVNTSGLVRLNCPGEVTVPVPARAAAVVPAAPANGATSVMPVVESAAGQGDCQLRPLISVKATPKTDVALSGVSLPGDESIGVEVTAAHILAGVNIQGVGAVHVLNKQTLAVIQTVPLPGRLQDMDVDEVAGQLVVALDTAVLRFDVRTLALAARIDAGAARVDVAANGILATVSGKTVTVYDKTDAVLGQFTRSARAVTDVAVRGCGVADQTMVYVTSYENHMFAASAAPDTFNPVQIARLEAYTVTGARLWKKFDTPPAQIEQNVADTRLNRVEIGADGYLYIAGETAGSASIFRWSGNTDLTVAEQFGKLNGVWTPTALTTIDAYTQLHNTGAAHESYYARLNPETGQLLTAQITMARLPNGYGNTFYVGDIAANPFGYVTYGGQVWAQLADRAAQKHNAQPIGAYAGGEPGLLRLAPDFASRVFWTALNAGQAKGFVRAVDADHGISASLSDITAGQAPVTVGGNTGTVHLAIVAD